MQQQRIRPHRTPRPAPDPAAGDQEGHLHFDRRLRIWRTHAELARLDTARQQPPMRVAG